MADQTVHPGGECWAVLGIAATGDLDAIKRAYASALKTIRPEEDPRAFRALRAAFEAAREAAPRVAPRPQVVAEVTSRAAIVTMPRQPERTAQATASRPREVDPSPQLQPGNIIRNLISVGDVRGAARAWRAAANGAALEVLDEVALQRRIAEVANADISLDATALQEIAELTLLDAAARELEAPRPVVSFVQRLAAERWGAEIRAAAAATRPWYAPLAARDRAARRLLRGPPNLFERAFPYTRSPRAFDYWLIAAAMYPGYVRDHFNPARIAWCERAQHRLDARLFSAIWRFNVLMAALLFCTIVVSIVVGIVAR